jgi:hypothetical protein
VSIIDHNYTLITTTPSEVSPVNKTDISITTTTDVPPVDVTLITTALPDNSVEVTK